MCCLLFLVLICLIPLRPPSFVHPSWVLSFSSFNTRSSSSSQRLPHPPDPLFILFPWVLSPPWPVSLPFQVMAFPVFKFGEFFSCFCFSVCILEFPFSLEDLSIYVPLPIFSLVLRLSRQVPPGHHICFFSLLGDHFFPLTTRVVFFSSSVFFSQYPFQFVFVYRPPFFLFSFPQWQAWPPSPNPLFPTAPLPHVLIDPIVTARFLDLGLDSSFLAGRTITFSPLSFDPIGLTSSSSFWRSFYLPDIFGSSTLKSFPSLPA